MPKVGAIRMAPINVYNWNYSASDLLKKYDDFLSAQKSYITRAVQRSVLFTTPDSRKDFAMGRIDILGPEDATDDSPKTLDYETFCFIREPLTLEELRNRLEGVGTLQFRVGALFFQFAKGFAFTNPFVPPSNQ